MLKRPKLYFISFADSRMSAATDRIREQARHMNVFDDIYVFNEDSLDDSFRQQWEGVMKFGSRGYGYWCWKPYIILKLLETLPEDSVLLYCDAGSHLNPKGRRRLLYYVDSVMESQLGVKAFDAFYSQFDVIERRWTKGDVFEYFKCRERKDVTDSRQIATGQIFIRKCKTSMLFLQEWNSVWYEKFSLIDDSPSVSPNFSDFVENRHDQSIFSVLYKLASEAPLPSGETDVVDYSNMDEYPIWNLRDKGYKDTRFIARVRRWIKAQRIVFKIRYLRIREKILGLLGR